MAATKQVGKWDFSKISEWWQAWSFLWQAVPVGGQHLNGQAERLIGIVKKTLS